MSVTAFPARVFLCVALSFCFSGQAMAFVLVDSVNICNQKISLGDKPLSLIAGAGECFFPERSQKASEAMRGDASFYLMYASDRGEAKITVARTPAGGWEISKIEVPPKTIAFSPFLVNIATEGSRYMKIDVSASLEEEKVFSDIEKNMHKARDSIIVLLAATTYAQMRDREGVLTLKKEIRSAINKVLGYNGVNEVYITDLIIQ